MRDYKEELVKNYGCVDCEATDKEVEKYQKVEDNFRNVLNERRKELGITPLTFEG
jgi:hypothetical protein